MTPGSTLSDQRVDTILGNLLRWGVILATTVVIIGGVFYLIHYGDRTVDLSDFRGEPEELRSVGGIIDFALDGRRRGIIQLGLLLLIATPIARVIFSVIVFALQRDLTYIIVTLIVLSVLLYGLLTG
jgi:uncharacterized membrane protein